MARHQVVALLALAAVLASCATPAPPVPRIVVREVKVPVPVERVPPENLKKCGSEPPGFRFFGTTDPRYRTGLDRDGESRLREWVDSKDRCITAWRVWAKPEAK